MAAPAVSHNTPVAGSISWTGFGIQYNGGSYTVPAGSTANRFVWWKFNAGAPALQQGNALPADLTVDDLILFINKNGTGARVPDANLFDGSLIVGGSILAPAIAVDAITTDHIQANAIATEHIGSNTIVATHIQGGQVTADKLSVGTVSDNLVANGSFEDFITGNLIGWEINALTNGTITPVTGKSSSGAVSMEMAATTTTANLRFRQLPQQFIPVSSASGRKMYVAARAAVSVALTTGFYIRVNWYDANRVLLTSGGTTDIRSNGSLTTTFTIYEGQATIPAAARFMGMEILLVNPNVITNVYVDEVTVHEVTMTAQIGDGQISAVKILANSITGDRIQAATIGADRLLVSDRTNYWENPDFEGDTALGIPKGTTNTNTTNSRVIATAGARGSAKCLEFNALTTGNNDAYSTNVFPVEPGDQFYIQYDWKFLNAIGTGQGAVGFRGYGPNKVALNQWWSVGTGASKPTVWQEDDLVAQTFNAKVGEYTVPAGTYFLQPYVSFTANGETTNRFHVDNIIIRRMNGGELLVDGSIGAEHIASNVIRANHIGSNVITSNHIGANTITGDMIKANALDAKIITGSTVQTAESGARVLLDSTGLRAWDVNNKQYLTADSTGLTVDGTLSALGKGYSSGNNQIDMNLTVGARGQHRRTIATQQWPPPPAPTAQAIPGVTFKPVTGTMYNYAGMYSENGYALGLSSGTGDTSPTGTDPTTLLLHTNAIYANKVIDAPAYTVNGLNMAAASVVVMDFANITAAHGMVTTLGAGTVNAGLSTDTSWGTPGYNQPGTIYLSGSGSTVYDIDANLTMDGAANGRGFIDVEHLNSAGVYVANLGRFTFTGDDSVHGSLSGVMLGAGSYVRLRVYQQSGSSRATTSARIRMKKVVGPAPSASWAPGDQTFNGNVVVNNKITTNDLTVTGPIQAKHRRVEFFNAFDVAGGALWDTGPVTMDTSGSARTTDTTMAVKHVNTPGAITFNEAGYYSISLFVVPRNNPGLGWIRLLHNNGENLGQAGNTTAIWETYVATVPVWFDAGGWVRSQISYGVAHTIDVRWKIVKVSS